MTGKDTKEMYKTEFSSDRYLEDYHDKMYSWQYFYMSNIYELCTKGVISGKRVIDIGAGPTIHIIATVSKFCETIVTSDFLDSNRNHLRHWWKNNPEAFDWTPHLKYCAELEGFSNLDDGVTEITSRLRSKIKDILYCDITQEYPLERQVEPFDVVLTTLCLDAAFATIEDYVAGVKNLTKLLKPKGKLVMGGVIDATWYFVGDVKFPNMLLNESIVRNALESAGCTVYVYKESALDDLPKSVVDAPTVYFTVATKN